MDAITRLQGVYFLEQLLPEELAALASICHAQHYVGADDILHQGEPTTRFYIVDEGHVNLRHTDKGGFETPVSSKGPGEYFGVKMFTTQELSEYTFEAVGAAAVWMIDRDEWDILLETYPDILDHMPQLRDEYSRLTQGLDWLSPGEALRLVTRRHWWALFLMIRNALLVAILAVILFWVSMQFQLINSLTWITPLFFGLLGFCLLWAFYRAGNWFEDTYIVTNKRVVRINRVLFVSDSRQEMAIERIQQEEVERGGPISVFLNISNLRISSAAIETGGVVFQQIGNVERVQKVIDAERARVTEKSRAAERERIRNMLANELRHYVSPHPTSEVRAAAPPMPKGLRERLRARLRGPNGVALPLNVRMGIIFNSLLGTEMRTTKMVTWRKHYIVLWRQIWISLLATFLLVTLLGVILETHADFGLDRNGIYLGLGAAIAVAFGIVVWQWLDWRVDLYKLTETEIIDIESLPFGLRYSEKKAELVKIQNVNFARPRFLNTLFDFGNVDTRVAGNAPAFTFDSVAHPHLVADEIQARIQLLQFKIAEDEARREMVKMVDAIVAYHRLISQERVQNPPPTAAPIVITAPAQEPPAPLEVIATPAPLRLPAPKDGEFPPEG